LGFFWENGLAVFFPLHTYLPTVPAYVNQKKLKKSLKKSMEIIIAGVLLKDFTTVLGGVKITKKP
jgi:hypothetical protein